MKHYLKVLKKFYKFSGICSRQEFWMYMLFSCVITWCMATLVGLLVHAPEGANSDTFTGTYQDIFIIIWIVYLFFTMLTTLTAAIRRIHDTGNNGWLVLVPVFNIVLLFVPSWALKNRFDVEEEEVG